VYFLPQLSSHRMVEGWSVSLACGANHTVALFSGTPRTSFSRRSVREWGSRACTLPANPIALDGALGVGAGLGVG
jgi:hypothetical protein